MPRFGFYFSAVFTPLLLFIVSARVTLSAENPAVYGWRGDGSGCFPKAAPPTEWDAESKKNILWSVKVGPGRFSSPLVVGDKVFVLSEPAQLFCLNAVTGAILWQMPNGFSELDTKTAGTPAAGSPGNVTPMPVSDGQFVYAEFGCGIVACYDLNGHRRWIQYFDVPKATDFGRSSSPLLAGNKLIVNLHHMIALEVSTGSILWKNEKVLEKYGTPVAATIGGVDILLSPSGQVVRLNDGLILGAVPELQFASPIIRSSVAYFVGVSTSAIELSFRPPDSIQTKTLWTAELEGTFYASPVFENGLLVAASNEGKFYILDGANGNILSTKDIEIGSAGGHNNLPNANIYPSLSLAGPNLFLSNDIGETIVMEFGREYKEVHKNHLLEGSGGSAAIAGRHMYVRDGESLVCIGEK